MTPSACSSSARFVRRNAVMGCVISLQCPSVLSMLIEMLPPHTLPQTTLTLCPGRLLDHCKPLIPTRQHNYIFSLISTSRHRHDCKEQKDPPVFLEEGLLRHFAFCRGFLAVRAYDSWLA